MGIQINGQTDIISATDGSLTISGATLPTAEVTNLNATGIVTATSFSGPLTGNVTGNLTGTASTATAAATAYGLSGSPTLSGITSISTTNLTVNGNAYPSAGSLSNRNVIINGAMEIAQRGTSALTVSGSYPVDRFYISHNSDGAFSTVRDSESPNGFTYSTKVTTTTADASLTGSQRLLFVQTLEGQNVSFLDFGSASAKSITLSFWVRSSVIGTFSGSIANGVANRAYPFDYNISSADTWEYKTITIPGDTTGTWATDNSTGMQLIFSLGIASGYAGTAGAWAGSQLWGSTSGTANILGTLNATWYITGVQLEVGTVATPFEHRSYGQELALCQRYYQNYGTVVFHCWGHRVADTDGIRSQVFTYSSPMRAAPTMSYDDGAGNSTRVALESPARDTSTNVPFSFNQKYWGWDNAFKYPYGATGFSNGVSGILNAYNLTLSSEL